MRDLSKERDEAKEKWEAEQNDFIAKNDDNIVSYFKGLPKAYRKLWHDCFTGRNAHSRSKCIRGKCMDCSNYQKEEVKHCPVKTCPLWHIRPYRDK